MIKPFVISCCMMLTSVAQADSTLNFIAPGNVQIPTSVNDQFVRMQMSASEWVLYDVTKDAVSIVDDNKKEYSVIDKATISQLTTQFATQRSELEAMLKTMPAEQRKQMEQMMAEVLSAEKFNPTLKNGKGTQTVSGFECQPKDVYVNGEHKQRVCVVEADKLGISPAEWTTMTGLFDMFSKMPAGPKQPSLDQFGGVPVQISSPNGDVQQTLASVSHESVSADRFKVPAKYFRRELN